LKTIKLIQLLVPFVLMSVSLPAAPLGTAISYRGRLIDGGAPANGAYDLRFAAFDAAQAGSQFGVLLTNAATLVDNGLFTVNLDFGPEVFTGDARWLEIGVRPAGSADNFIVLSPRQLLAPTPYALHASTAGSAASVTGPVAASQVTGTLASSNIGAGSITASQLASGAAFTNLYAVGQSGVALGGVVMSEDPDNDYLLHAGYIRLGSSTSLSITEESWRNLASLPVYTTQPIEGREWHTVIWTGSEMIAWGGYNDRGTLNTGARYDPAVNAWTAVAQSNAPSARFNHSAVWTGTQMIIWGGQPGLEEDGLNTGKRYNPATGIWSAMSVSSAPSGRQGHVAIWAGNVMVVWGGHAESHTWSDRFSPGNSTTSDLAQDGGRYNPTSDTWSAVRTNAAPSPRSHSAAVWTGSEMIVWGGYYSELVSSLLLGSGTNEIALNDGGRYRPATDTWTAMNSSGAPTARYRASAVWTGSRMVVWGGSDLDGVLGNGGRYDPSANAWTSVSTVGAPVARTGHTAAWTGTRMVVWGGEAGGSALDSGGRYDPSANTWAGVSSASAPSARRNPTSVWTGSRMLVWGGRGQAAGDYLGVGSRYDPTNNTWALMSAMPASSEPWARRNATALWTGNEMIIWGGDNDGQYLRSGARFNPAANAWSALPITNAPAARSDHTAVWTGTEMLVWGGFNGKVLGSGARYSPAQNSWSLISTNGAPTARRAHTAVWTGNEMLVWGGYTRAGKLSNFLGTGGRYAANLNTWSQMSTNGAPAVRAGHTAVWTGSEMIVWGGYVETGAALAMLQTAYLNSGARYQPELDLDARSKPWTATSAPRMISARRAHTAIWTGSEMIVWGGETNGTALNTGFRYQPSADTWRSTSLADAPSPRQDHTAVWTGMHMLVWGGRERTTEFNHGARYSPILNMWWPITTGGAPSARYLHNAVWTGNEMLIWGGDNGITCLDTIRGYTPPVRLYLYVKP
jgi:N-acetylneuraminic acid mutarotase